MSCANDRDYYERRAEQERARAKAASDATAAWCHSQMAQRYSDKAMFIAEQDRQELLEVCS